jgi:hypothetical protein
MCSFDIKDMFSNIPKADVIYIIKNITDIPLNTISQKEIIELLGTILEQNYFQFNQKYYRHTEGLSMGAPTSAILAEIYTQHMEHKQLYPALLNTK